MAREKTTLTDYATKKATPVQSRYADWLIEKVGYDPSGEKTKEAAFREGVRLGTVLRMQFQSSPENKAANAERKAANAERKAAVTVTDDGQPRRRGRPRAAAKSEATETPVEPKRRGRPAKVTEAAPESTETPVETPKKRGRPAKATAPVTAVSEEVPRRRGRPRAAATPAAF